MKLRNALPWLSLLLLLGFHAKSQCPSVNGYSLYEEDFESFPAGPFQPNNLRWEVYQSPTADEADITLSNSYEGNKSLYFYNDADMILKPPPVNGVIRLDMAIYLPNSKNGYMAPLYAYANIPGQTNPYQNFGYNIAFENGQGFVFTDDDNSYDITFNYPQNTWFIVTQRIDLNDDLVEVWVDGQFIGSWPYSDSNPDNGLTFYGLNLWTSGFTDEFFIDLSCNKTLYAVPFQCPTNYNPVCVNGKEFSNECFAKAALYSPTEYGPCSTYTPCELGTFEYYNTGPVTNYPEWRLWASNSGDATVSTNYAYQGNKSLRISSQSPATDVVYNLGNLDVNDGAFDGNDVYRYSWKMYVPPGFGGYYNMQHDQNILGNYAYEVYFQPDGSGNVILGGTQNSYADFTYPHGQWFSVTQIIRLQDDIVELWINGSYVSRWTFSTGTSPLNQIGAFNFYGWDNLNSLYYIDDFCPGEERCFGFIVPIGEPYICVNGYQYEPDGLNGENYAYCDGYSPEEWTVGRCNAGPCYDCFDCFYYVPWTNDPLTCNFRTTYCEPYRELPTLESQGSYSYQWTVPGHNVSFVNGTSNTSLYPDIRFPGTGNYEVCLKVYYTYDNGNTVLVYTCCLNVWAGTNPNCNRPPVAYFDYAYNSNSNTFTLNASGSTRETERKWHFGDDYNHGSSVNYISGDSTSLAPSIRIPNGQCRSICLWVKNDCGMSTYCVTLCNTNPECSGYTPFYTMAGMVDPVVNQNQVSFSGIPAPPAGSDVTFNWDFGDGTGKSTARNPSYTYPSHGKYLICLVIEIGCKKICYCWTVYTNPCPPPDKFYCGSISHRYNGTGNNLSFTFNSTQNIASGYRWRINDQDISGATGNTFNYTFPAPGQYEICLPYYDGDGCLQYCCYDVDIFNPFDCYTFDYRYVDGQGFQFELQTNLGTPTNISWTNDNNNSSLGNGLVSNFLPVPGTCEAYTITVRYFLNGYWIICCRTVWLCNPFEYNCFGFRWNPGTNAYDFSLDQSGATNISWTIDETGQQFGTSRNASYPFPGTCEFRTITIRYRLGGTWYICCRRVWICNPINCEDAILYDVENNGDLVLNTDNSYEEVEWFDGDTQIGSGTNISRNYPIGSTVTICLYYRHNGYYYVCCRTIVIQPCNLPDPFFLYSVDGQSITFSNESTDANSYNWNFGNGQTSNQEEPGTIFYQPGNYRICLTATNACGSNTHCVDVTIEDNTVLPPWTPSPTSLNHTILIQGNLVSDIDGTPVQPGDYIGVFFMRNGQEVCSNYQQWEPNGIGLAAYGNDLGANGKNGFSPGEPFILKVWRSANQTEYDCESVFMDPPVVPFDATDKWVNDGISNLLELFTSSSKTQIIQLSEGWNMISSYIQPDNTNMLDILAQLAGKVVLIKDEDGTTTVPSANINSLGDWIIEKGYKIRVTEDVELEMTGIQVDPGTHPIQLENRWKIISYLCDNGNDPVGQFSNIAGQVVLVKDPDGKIFSPSTGINQIDCMEPGLGYQVLATQNVNLTYNCAGNCTPFTSDGTVSSRQAEDSENHAWFINTGNNATLIITQEETKHLSFGDQLEIRTKEGLIVGSGTYTGKPFAITIWGDDLYTKDRIEGLQNNETFLVYKNSSSNPVSLKNKDLHYNQDGIFYLKFEDQKQQETQIYPNPSDGHFTLVPGTAPSSEVRIKVMDLQGRMVFESIEGSLKANNNISLNLSHLDKGIYLLQMKSGDQLFNSKIIIQ